jgi:Domain of unknown function DUF29
VLGSIKDFALWRLEGEMAVRMLETLPSLHDLDETAWLDAMAELARQGRGDALDLPNLAEYLADMARRDRREVESRLVVLMAHLLKWEHQPERRSRSWRCTVIEQRQELRRLAARGVLRAHAEDVLADVYPEAIERAAAETGLAGKVFPETLPFTLEQLLDVDLPQVNE